MPKKGHCQLWLAVSENVFKQIEPVLEVLGSNINYVGSAETVNIQKVIIKLLLAGALAEFRSLTCAKAVNLDPQIML